MKSWPEVLESLQKVSEQYGGNLKVAGTQVKELKADI